MSVQITQTLEQAIDGLLYTSESDEPFEVVRWTGDGKPLDARKLLELASYPPGAQVTTISLDDFFRDLTTVQSWYGDEEKSTVRRYQSLEDAIRRNLRDVRVFRVGEVRVDIYVMGVTGDGDWAGVKTTSVET
jgi:hypothetical protein